MGSRGQPPAKPGQLAVANQLVTRDAQGSQTRRMVEGATPEGGDVVVFDGSVIIYIYMYINKSI